MQPRDPIEFLASFLPGDSRELTRTGVQIHCLQYWCDAFESWVGQHKEVHVHYDPRDITYVYVRTPCGPIVKAAVTTPGIPVMSLAEWHARRDHERSLSRRPEAIQAQDDSLRRSNAIVEKAIKQARSVKRRMATNAAGDVARDESMPSRVEASEGAGAVECVAPKMTLAIARTIYSIEGDFNDY